MNVDTHLYYLLAMFFSFLGPFALSFDKKVNFKQYFKPLLVATLLVASPFIIGDIFYTKWAIWGFNEKYHLSTKVLGLPLEEISFFLIIPYCCVFIYECIKAYFDIKIDKLIYRGCFYFAAAFLVLAALNYGKAYTAATFLGSAILLFFISYNQFVFTNYLIISFLVSIIPFIIVNGFLTGMFMQEPIVWYNDHENLAIRFFSIPIEDFSYSFNLISLNILVFEYFKKKI